MVCCLPPNETKHDPWNGSRTHTCWYTSERPLLMKYWLLLQRRTPRHIWVRRFPSWNHVGLSNLHWVLVEARLESERLEAEQRKREREEQHLYLTAKARSTVTAELFQIDDGSICRSSQMNPFSNTRVSTLLRLMTRIGHHPTYRTSAYSRLNLILHSRLALHNISITLKIKFAYGYWSIGKIRRCGLTLMSRRTRALWVRQMKFTLSVGWQAITSRWNGAQ